jgi:primosomal protein N' (replication factor Y) (superfamily II helicase)
MLFDEPSPPALPLRRVSVCVPLHVDGCFDYLTETTEPLLGRYVTVSFAGQKMMGVVWGDEGTSTLPNAKLKTIAEVHWLVPPMQEALRSTITKAAHYNCAALGNMLRLAMPVMEKAADTRLKPRKTAPTDAPALVPTHHTLTPDQHAAAHTMQAALLQGFQPFLLDGETGAGKTEVFFEVAEAAMREGLQVLLLVPEIALSVPLLKRAEARFGFTPTLWHSSETPAKRREALRAILNGSARLIIGARSALFLPYASLGLIIVDEEHDSAFKQEGTGMYSVMYHGRDMGVLRAREERIPIILSSATPALETLVNADRGKYHHLKLTRREGQAALPTVHLLDMRREKLARQHWISPTLQQRLQDALNRGEQSLLFMNRRGYAPLVLCRACGHRYECPNCTAWLVFHASKRRMQCHHCGLSVPMPPHCPSCQADPEQLVACGPGVERIEEEVRGLFPIARLCVISGDSTEDPKRLKALLEAASAGEIDIIIGTQLLAKGHHFPKLTTVGVVDADAGLQGGDIRAGERTYQLLHQLAGRAGREEARGRVFVQTYQPDHPLMQALAAWDREGFLRLEMEKRQRAAMPPYGRLCAVIVEGEPEEKAVEVARALSMSVPNIQGVQILGAAPAPLYKLRGQYRLRFLVVAPKSTDMHAVVKPWCDAVPHPKSVSIRIDVDPVSFL